MVITRYPRGIDFAALCGTEAIEKEFSPAYGQIQGGDQMSLTVKLLQNQGNEAGIAANQAVYKKQGTENGKAIFAGALGIPSQTDSLVEEKRQNAKKQAMKLVGDAWGRDQKAAQNIKDKWALWGAKQIEIKDCQSRISDIEEAKGRLQQQYEVDPESREQKDLEILERFQDYLKGLGDPGFSEEELDRLEELQNMPRTDYQIEVLKLNDDAGEEKKGIMKLQFESECLKGKIFNAEQEQAMSQDMLKANDAAQQILDAADKEITNLLIQEGKENIDEKTEEEKEEAEETQEKKEEQQERIEKIKDKTKENREEQEEMIDGELKADRMEMEVSMKQRSVSHIETAQKNIQKIMKENNLVNEDLKGIEIDFGF